MRKVSSSSNSVETISSRSVRAGPWHHAIGVWLACLVVDSSVSFLSWGQLNPVRGTRRPFRGHWPQIWGEVSYVTLPRMWNLVTGRRNTFILQWGERGVEVYSDLETRVYTTINDCPGFPNSSYSALGINPRGGALLELGSVPEKAQTLCYRLLIISHHQYVGLGGFNLWVFRWSVLMGGP